MRQSRSTELWESGGEGMNCITVDQGFAFPVQAPAYSLRYPTPSLDHILGEIGPLPSGSVVLGLCDDGLPIILDLLHPEAGSILVTGDSGSGKSHLLQRAIASACRTNSPRQLRFSTIGLQAVEAASLANFYHCTSYEEEQTSWLILEHAQAAEQRCYEGELGPALLLVIDDIDRLIDHLDDHAYQALLDLLKNGPAVQIWVIASLDAKALGKVPVHLLDAFGTWMVGYIQNQSFQTGMNLAHLPVESAHDLIPSAQFNVSCNGEWIKFWIPDGQI